MLKCFAVRLFINSQEETITSLHEQKFDKFWPEITLIYLEDAKNIVKVSRIKLH